VVQWLQSNGISDIHSKGDAIKVYTTVELASKLFNTQFHRFYHNDGRMLIRTYGESSMPLEIINHVNFVEGISNFPQKHYKAHIQTPTAGQQGVIPASAAALYQIPTLSSGAYPETSVGVIEFDAQSFSPADLNTYSRLVNVTVLPLTANHIIGPNQASAPQLEATLDIQFVATINNAATSWFWLEDGDNWLYQYVNNFFNANDVPQAASISYGWSESDQCDIDPVECQTLGVDSQGYVSQVNAEFQKIALRGVSLFVASGDSGANGRTDGGCSLPYLKPDYPAACPFITSVGATQINNPEYNLINPPPICVGHGYSCVSGGDEVAVSFDHANFASGGGFSNYYPQQTHQKAAVSAYLNSGVALPPSSYFNASNRAYPDVAAVGSDVLVYQSGIEDVGGTSCSSPAFAAVAALLNHYAIQKTGKPLGFLNPFIYKMFADDPTTFHDITVGDNKCTEDGCDPNCQGFLAAPGWDPVTGFGTPNVARMINYIQTHL